jgi:hypothetical protein
MGSKGAHGFDFGLALPVVPSPLFGRHLSGQVVAVPPVVKRGHTPQGIGTRSIRTISRLASFAVFPAYLL